MVEKVEISVIIPTHNRSDALDLTIAHLAKQDFSGSWEGIIVNNNSTDNTDEIVNTWKKKFPVELTLLHESKPGPAAARNSGARAARGEYLIFVDNDILTETDFLARHYRTLTNSPGSWVVGQCQNLPEQQATVFGRYREWLFPIEPVNGVVRETDFLTGQGTSMPAGDFERLKGFDEGFYVASGEDRELALRAKTLGVRILFDPSIVAYHNDWAGSTIRDYCRRQRVYTQTEPLFEEKYGSSNPRHELAVKNSAPSLRKDGAWLFVFKHAKRVFGTDLLQSVTFRVCDVTEKIAPNSKLLWRLYRFAIAGSIYRGYQEGLDELNRRKHQVT